ncbi:NACHT domain-containing protein [Streptomyces sp. NPDC048417]|uniref:NACHT domain-containing protein n=1 Tax=Streptomyces sp. NPDC048417 TaxID=3155387 RepID=UPI003429A11E
MAEGTAGEEEQPRHITNANNYGEGPLTVAGSIGVQNNNYGSPEQPQHGLAAKADQLAEFVRQRRQDEETQLGIRDPQLLPVRWEPPDDKALARDHPELVWEDAREGNLSGGLDGIAAFYGSIPSGRLVVLGRAGSGKSVLGMQFVLQWLKRRPRGAPVPEIFSLASWNPEAEPLNERLSHQLGRDQPWLTAVASDGGMTLAEKLVSAGLILPVLDGFDEIPRSLRGAALRQLSETSMPFVLTSRYGQYKNAVRGRGLHKAAVVRLVDLPPADSVTYLRFSSPPDAKSAWDPVLADMDANPYGPLRQALSTPLMVALAAAVHGERGTSGPDALLDAAEFPTPDRLEQHLLTAFLPSVYRRPAQARRAQRWLTYLAHDLEQRKTHNLAWWELGTTLPLRQRTAVIAFLAGLSFAVVTAIGNIPVDLVATSHGLGFAVRRGLVVGSLHGLLLGAAFGFIYHRASGNDLLKPSPIEITLRRDAQRQLGEKLLSRITIGSLVALAGAVAIVAVDRSVVPWLGLDDGLGGGLVSAAQFPLIVGLGTGLVLGITAWLEATVDVNKSVSCVGLLRMNRRNVHAHILVWALVFGFIAWFSGSFTETPLRSIQLGLVFGIEGAFAGGLGYGLCLTAWGQWVALARVWLPLTGRLPWRLVTFLEDACDRRALRRAGAVYQFRHGRLQEQLTALDEKP